MSHDRESTRYPYTYGHDFVREAFSNRGGGALSRADVAKLDEIYSRVCGMTPQQLAEAFADKYIEYRNAIGTFEP